MNDFKENFIKKNINQIKSNIEHFEKYKNFINDIDYCNWIAQQKVVLENYYISRSKSSPTQLTFAMRFHIHKQIEKFKQDVFSQNSTVFCPLTTRELSWNDCHVDHTEIPFCKIQQNFFLMNDIDPSDVRCRKARAFGGKCVFVIDDETIRNLWMEFHQKHACLQVICPTANKVKSAKQWTEELKVRTQEKRNNCRN